MKILFSILIIILITIIFTIISINNKTKYDNIPTTISEEAQSILKDLYLVNLFSKKAPRIDDLEGWRKVWEENEKLFTANNREIIEKYDVKINLLLINGVKVLEIIPSNVRSENKVLVYTHGGAYTALSANSTLPSSARMASVTGLKVYSIDYTLAPFANWEGIQSEVLRVFAGLLQRFRMEDIGIFGDSAGGGLVLSTVLNLRNLGWGMPAAVLLISPWADLTGVGDTYQSLKKSEPVLNYDKALKNSALVYADELKLDDPRISPLFADFSKGFPPTLIVEGTKDIFLSTIVMLYQKMKNSGVDVTLDVFEGMWHVFIGFDIPESEIAFQDFNNFWNKYL